jgi:Secretion system C-terminal sorting domain/Cohesin domain
MTLKLRVACLILGIFLCVLRAQAQPAFRITTPDAYGLPGDTVCMPFRVFGFEQVVSYNWVVNWDPAVASFNRLEPSYVVPFLEPSFNANNPGRLIMAWNDITGIGTTVPDSGVLFTLCLRVTGNIGEGTFVSVDTAGLPNGVAIGIQTINAGQNIWSELSNVPGTLIVGTNLAHPIDQQAIRVFPNPARQFIFLSDVVIGSNVEIIDIEGRSSIHKKNISDPQIDISTLYAGRYILRITDPHGMVFVTSIVVL